MAEQRYLNIKYKALPIAEVNVTGISRLGGIKEAINKALSVGPAYGLTQLYDKDNTLITDLRDVTDEYYKAIRDGGLALTIQTTPPPSRVASSSSVIANTSVPEASSLGVIANKSVPEASISSVTANTSVPEISSSSVVANTSVPISKKQRIGDHQKKLYGVFVRLDDIEDNNSIEFDCSNALNTMENYDNWLDACYPSLDQVDYVVDVFLFDTESEATAFVSEGETAKGEARVKDFLTKYAINQADFVMRGDKRLEYSFRTV
ncbi:hypothetical protein CcCBS67573_g03551 [Chytriomyces confervae]|uniref:Uncharacterized protein n=1 Tax=Chytriomyces confervae TaxID=246404 RepID=A0A507FIN3_9FUNG|nr:hypothetical protein HDU80_011305 [Chytriomyces hyalinus]TPX75176.1 hypothetical protein CcCBS67573_g03551 [Chytriomyces confervae]